MLYANPRIRMMNGLDYKNETPLEVELSFTRLDGLATRNDGLALTMSILRQLRDNQRRIGYQEDYEDVIAIWPSRWADAMPWLRRNTLIGRLERLNDMGLIDMWLNEPKNKRFVKLNDEVIRQKGERW